jgi:hypothetical protein
LDGASFKEHEVHFMPWTRSDKREQAPRKSLKETVTFGCVAVGIALLFFIPAGIAAVAFMVGIEALAGWMLGLIKPLIEPLMGPTLYALFGVGMVSFAAWGLFRLATGHAPPGTSRRDMGVIVLGVVCIAVAGVVFLLGAFGPQTRDAPTF